MLDAPARLGEANGDRNLQSSGVPVYLQLIEQVKHAVETGALKVGDHFRRPARWLGNWS
jgi:hypothetical protein